MDWEEYVKETSCLRILQDLLFPANTYHPSLRETDIKHFSDKINKEIEQNRVTREPYDKIFFGKEPIYHNREIPFCLLSKKSFLNLKAMNVTHTL